jgi:3-oxoacyl-[acyl-carrier protein] reductase
MEGETRKERVVLVTGAAQGIGRAVADAFLENGDIVVLTDRDDDGVAKAALELDPSGKRSRALRLDVRDLDALSQTIDEIKRTFGGVDILVNNAGLTHMRTIWEITPEDWEELFSVNLRPVFFLSRLAAIDMRERKWGRIINLASVAGLAPRPSGAHYGASKAAVISLTRAFALELAPDGVTVNAVAPGLVDTAMSGVIPTEMRERMLNEVIPIRRISTAREVASLVRYLGSDDASYITGATYDINGGVIMR